MVPTACAIVMALTRTPRISTRGYVAASWPLMLATTREAALRDGVRSGIRRSFDIVTVQVSCNFAFDPCIRACEPIFERYGRLPGKYLTQSGVVGVTAAHALRAVYMAYAQVHTGSSHDYTSQFVDRDETILAEVERLRVVGPHQAM